MQIGIKSIWLTKAKMFTDKVKSENFIYVLSLLPTYASLIFWLVFPQRFATYDEMNPLLSRIKKTEISELEHCWKCLGKIYSTQQKIYKDVVLISSNNMCYILCVKSCSRFRSNLEQSWFTAVSNLLLSTSLHLSFFMQQGDDLTDGSL